MRTFTRLCWLSVVASFSIGCSGAADPTAGDQGEGTAAAGREDTGGDDTGGDGAAGASSTELNATYGGIGDGEVGSGSSALPGPGAAGGSATLSADSDSVAMGGSSSWTSPAPPTTGPSTGAEMPTGTVSASTGGAPGGTAPGGSVAVGGSSEGVDVAAGGAAMGGSGAVAGAVTGPTPVEPPTVVDPGFDPPIVVEPSPPPPQFEAGMLTAGAWDDNLNFDLFKAYRGTFLEGQPAGVPPYADAELEAAQALWAQAQQPKVVLDISLVIDTTGSMGDELGYLQQEFDALSATIETTYANSEQRWSLVVYRDVGDEYTVRHFDFRADAADFRDVLAAQTHGGGGDFPEAPEMALDYASQLSWRTSDEAAKLLFWVADAPHHDQNAGALADAVVALQDLGVHIYPVASSGVDALSEFSMRSAAQLTLGRYLFLTDDSGFGGGHMEPTTPCYHVTGLDDAILRMVELEMMGEAKLPDASDVVRSVGEPDDDGICMLASGSRAQAI